MSTKIIVTTALAALVCAGPSLAQEPAPSSQAPSNGTVPPPTLDTNGDGVMDAWDQRGDGRADTWDTDGDGRPDQVDSDSDGLPDNPDAETDSADPANNGTVEGVYNPPANQNDEDAANEANLNKTGPEADSEIRKQENSPIPE